jgi:hypothetical protein
MWTTGITLCLSLLLGSGGLLVLLGTAGRWFRDPGMDALIYELR